MKTFAKIIGIVLALATIVAGALYFTGNLALPEGDDE